MAATARFLHLLLEPTVCKGPRYTIDTGNENHERVDEPSLA